MVILQDSGKKGIFLCMNSGENVCMNSCEKKINKMALKPDHSQHPNDDSTDRNSSNTTQGDESLSYKS